MAIELPDEVIVQILTFLPAKSLLRWRSVCKCWLNLINSPKFKLMHLRNFNQLNPRYFVRRLLEEDGFSSEECYDVHLDDEAFTFDDATQIEFPFAPIRTSLCFRIVGCCNGVVCLCDDEYCPSSSDTLILWNPSIRRKLTLTVSKFNSTEFQESFVVLGFGYDKVSDDYKVVRLTYPPRSSVRPKVEVYTVKTGVWREVMFPDNLRCFYTHYNWSQMFSNGCVHWFARDPTPGVSHHSIMTFDLTTELFGEIELPEFLAREFLRVTVVGESLAIIHSSNLKFNGLKSRGSTYMVMVMKEYKNPTSWTMLYHIHHTKIKLGKPLRLRNNGDMIVELENKDMIMINNNESYYVYVYRGCVEEDFDFYVDRTYVDRTYVDRYEESLALLDVGDSVPDKEAMKALMVIEKLENYNMG